MVTESLEAIIAKVVDTSKADYAVITGIEVHAGNNVSGRYVQLRYSVNTKHAACSFLIGWHCLPYFFCLQPFDSPFDPSNVVEYIVPSSAYAVVNGEKQSL